MSARSLREKYYLIGYASNQLTGSKLPSKKEVIKVLFFNWRVVKLSIRESAKLVIEELLIFWEKARIPTREKQHCIAKLEKLHTEWTNLKKSCGRNTDNQKNKEKKWVESLEQIFDVAHANALEIITVEEDKAFLISQRQEGRPGHMYGIDYKTLQMEIQAEHREQIKLKRLERNKREQNIISETVQFRSSSESDQSFQSPQSHDESVKVRSKNARVKQKIISPKLAIALDYCKISNRNAVHIISAVLQSLGKDIANYIINRSSIHKAREKMRKKRALELKKNFKFNKQDIRGIHR